MLEFQSLTALRLKAITNKDRDARSSGIIDMISKQLERLRRISSCLDHVDKIHLREIARLLEVSEMTIRRDINSPAAINFKLESYGGFVRKQTDDSSADIQAITIKKNAEVDELSLCIIAAKQIITNDMVFFDNSDYSNEIISSIDKSISFTGVTYSLTTFLELKTKPNCQAILLGGAYDPTLDIFKIDHYPSWFESIVFNKSFITPDGVHSEFGVTFKDNYCTSVITEVIKRSIKKYIICPKASLNNISTYSVNISLFDYIITACIPEDIAEKNAIRKLNLISSA